MMRVDSPVLVEIRSVLFTSENVTQINDHRVLLPGGLPKCGERTIVSVCHRHLESLSLLIVTFIIWSGCESAQMMSSARVCWSCSSSRYFTTLSIWLICLVYCLATFGQLTRALSVLYRLTGTLSVCLCVRKYILCIISLTRFECFARCMFGVCLELYGNYAATWEDF